MSANLCRRNVVVRDGPEGFTTFKLDMAAIAQKLLVGRAQLWSTEANCFVFSAVLVDSLSEVTMAVEPFFMNGVTKGSLRLHGPAATGGSSLVAQIEGVLKLKVNLDGDEHSAEARDPFFSFRNNVWHSSRHACSEPPPWRAYGAGSHGGGTCRA